jgi:hypothetical protein
MHGFVETQCRSSLSHGVGVGVGVCVCSVFLCLSARLPDVGSTFLCLAFIAGGKKKSSPSSLVAEWILLGQAPCKS